MCAVADDDQADFRHARARKSGERQLNVFFAAEPSDREHHFFMRRDSEAGAQLVAAATAGEGRNVDATRHDGDPAAYAERAQTPFHRMRRYDDGVGNACIRAR